MSWNLRCLVQTLRAAREAEEGAGGRRGGMEDFRASGMTICESLAGRKNKREKRSIIQAVSVKSDARCISRGHVPLSNVRGYWAAAAAVGGPFFLALIVRATMIPALLLFPS